MKYSHVNKNKQHGGKNALFWGGVFTLLCTFSLFHSMFISSINVQTAPSPYLDSPSTFPPADKLISKRILGMLWGKYNSVSCSQLLDRAVKDNCVWKKVRGKKRLFTSSAEKRDLDLCLMWIPLQWCNQNFNSKTPPVFFFFSPRTRPPPLPVSRLHLYPP